ncbi:MAG: hypothetical protein GQ570_01130 [Helicobacteraceae bacterium]|nr:hypothetical protein [Helicobacteraceae bacterium]
MSKMINGLVALALSATVALGDGGVRFNVIDGDAEKKYNTLVGEQLESSGFILSDPHERINDAYSKRYGNPKDPDYDKEWKTTLDNLGFFSVSNDVGIRELLLKEPRLGGFSPFNLHIYKNTNEDKTYVGHLTPSVMLDIVGVEDKAVREAFTKTFEPLDAIVSEKLGGKVEYFATSNVSKTPMMNFEIEFERPEDLEEYIEEFQDNFEGAFEENKYIIAGYKDYKEAYSELELDFPKYDAYFVYSLCHFTFSYNVFNKGRGDAGVFAPCAMYMYIEKGSNKLIIGMPTLDNWATVMGIKDPVKLKWIKKTDDEIIQVMKDLGATYTTK